MQCGTYKPYGRKFLNTEQNSIGIYPLTEIPLLGIYPKDIMAKKNERYMHKAIHCSIIYNNKDRKQSKYL